MLLQTIKSLVNFKLISKWIYTLYLFLKPESIDINDPKTLMLFFVVSVRKVKGTLVNQFDKIKNVLMLQIGYKACKI